MAKITMNDLLEAGCHFGHQTRRWNPRMKKYVYGAKSGISIIDLSKTMHQLASACNFLQSVVVKGGDILFVGTKRQASDIIAELAEKTGMYSVSERWLGGTLTNNVTIRKSITKMQEIDEKINSEAAASMKKKELSLLQREAEKLHRNLDGICEMKRLPAALVIVDVCHEANAVREANKLNIPIVALVDTDGDPSQIDYPVAANDDAVKSIQIIPVSSAMPFWPPRKSIRSAWSKKRQPRAPLKRPPLILLKPLLRLKTSRNAPASPVLPRPPLKKLLRLSPLKS